MYIEPWGWWPVNLQEAIGGGGGCPVDQYLISREPVNLSGEVGFYDPS